MINKNNISSSTGKPEWLMWHDGFTMKTWDVNNIHAHTDTCTAETNDVNMIVFIVVENCEIIFDYKNKNPFRINIETVDFMSWAISSFRFNTFTLFLRLQDQIKWISNFSSCECAKSSIFIYCQAEKKRRRKKEKTQQQNLPYTLRT